MKFFTLFLIGCFILCSTITAQADSVKRTAKVLSARGTVEVLIAGQKNWTNVAKGSMLNEGDMLRTGANSAAILNVDGNGETATVSVQSNTQMMLSELIKDPTDGTEKTLLDVAVGKIRIKAQKLHTPESQFEVKTPTSVVAVRGTEFSVEVEAVE